MAHQTQLPAGEVQIGSILLNVAYHLNPRYLGNIYRTRTLISRDFLKTILPQKNIMKEVTLFFEYHQVLAQTEKLGSAPSWLPQTHLLRVLIEELTSFDWHLPLTLPKTICTHHVLTAQTCLLLLLKTGKGTAK